MNYKKVIENQIKILEQVQDGLRNSKCSEESCNIAKTIASLCEEANRYVDEPENDRKGSEACSNTEIGELSKNKQNLYAGITMSLKAYPAAIVVINDDAKVVGAVLADLNDIIPTLDTYNTLGSIKHVALDPWSLLHIKKILAESYSVIEVYHTYKHISDSTKAVNQLIAEGRDIPKVILESYSDIRFSVDGKGNILPECKTNNLFIAMVYAYEILRREKRNLNAEKELFT